MHNPWSVCDVAARQQTPGTHRPSSCILHGQLHAQVRVCVDVVVRTDTIELPFCQDPLIVPKGQDIRSA